MNLAKHPVYFRSLLNCTFSVLAVKAIIICIMNLAVDIVELIFRDTCLDHWCSFLVKCAQLYLPASSKLADYALEVRSFVSPAGCWISSMISVELCKRAVWGQARSAVIEAGDVYFAEKRAALWKNSKYARAPLRSRFASGSF